MFFPVFHYTLSLMRETYIFFANSFIPLSFFLIFDVCITLFPILFCLQSLNNLETANKLTTLQQKGTLLLPGTSTFVYHDKESLQDPLETTRQQLSGDTSFPVMNTCVSWFPGRNWIQILKFIWMLTLVRIELVAHTPEFMKITSIPHFIGH